MEQDVRFVFFPHVCTNLFSFYLDVYLIRMLTSVGEEKEVYEADARQDKKRYTDEMKGYNNPQAAKADSGNDSDSD